SYGRRQAAAPALACDDMTAVPESPPPAPVTPARRTALAGVSAFVAGLLAFEALDPALSNPAGRILLGVNVAWFAVAAIYLRRAACSNAANHSRQTADRSREDVMCPPNPSR
ncbi:MAG TPA: hypothetical protein VFR67_29565, partial [Pilimelia sp.]|nr:hypothetical protein [Pilimelia sp.]